MQQVTVESRSHIPAVSDELLTSLGLSEDDTPEIVALADQIKVGSPMTVLMFGQSASVHSVSLADEMLEQVRSSELETAGQKLNEVVTIAKKMNLGPLSNARSRLPLVGKFIDILRLKASNVAGSLDTAKNQITTLLGELEVTQEGLQVRNQALEQMFGTAKDEYRALGLHIAAGNLKLSELKDMAQGYHLSPEDDPEKAQEVADLNDMISKLDKRVGDLGALRHSTLQSLPMIRMVQSNNQMLVEKFHTIKAVTVPAWQRQLSLRLALVEQENAVQLGKHIDDTTNQLLLENAKLLRDNSLNTARSNQRLVIDIETLEKTQQMLISTVQETVKIQNEGIAMRKQTEQRLEKLRVELVNASKAHEAN